MAINLKLSNNTELKVQTQLFINNQFVDAVEGTKLKVFNPATGKLLCEVASGGVKDVNKAVESARAAFHSWRRVSGSERGRLMNKLADLLERDQNRFATIDTVDNGKPTTQALAIDLKGAITCLRYYAGFCDKLPLGKVLSTGDDGSFVYSRHEPIGVCGAIIPWNFPLLMLMWKLAPAIATGNTLVLKSAEQTPLSCLTLGELVVEAGFPPGVINLITGLGSVCGEAITRHMDIDKVAFTGSTQVGRLILKASAESNLKKVTLELGGKSPLIIFNDASINDAVELTINGLFFNAGQVCTATSRIYVQEGIYDKYIEAVRTAANNLIVGDGLKNETFNGPQVSIEQLNIIKKYLEIGKKEGCKLVCGGGIKQLDGDYSDGYFVAPTVFECEDHHTIVKEEIFGPVLSVLKFKDTDEVIRRANSSQFGLAAGVLTNDYSTATKVAHSLRSGYVWINTVGSVSYNAPFGGYGQSGFGRELGEYGLESYMQIKTVYTKSTTLEGPFSSKL